MQENIFINTQSSIKIINDKVFYFDPFQISAELHDADYIFITHDHYDHLDPDSIINVKKDCTKFICPESIIDSLLSKVSDISKSSIITVNSGDNIKLDDKISIEVLPAYNINNQFHKKEFGWVGYILNIEDKKYYIAGDTDITPENKNVKCDVAFVPIGGTYTMNFNEAAELINNIKPKVAIPTHFGSIVGKKTDFDKFKSLLSHDIKVENKLF